MFESQIKFIIWNLCLRQYNWTRNGYRQYYLIKYYSKHNIKDLLIKYVSVFLPELVAAWTKQIEDIKIEDRALRLVKVSLIEK